MGLGEMLGSLVPVVSVDPGDLESAMCPAAG
jgi:hypothetical protein